jgi:hypothetical protein
MMNDNRSDHRDARSRSAWRHAVALTAATVGIAALVAACGGSGSGSAGSSPHSATLKALAYAQCMRSRGIANFPDPTQQGNSVGFKITLAGAGAVDINSPQYQSADKACVKSSGWTEVSQAALQQFMGGAVKYVACMRFHGITNFPDPVLYKTYIQLAPSASSHIDQNTPQYKAAKTACRPLLAAGGS